MVVPMVRRGGDGRSLGHNALIGTPQRHLSVQHSVRAVCGAFFHFALMVLLLLLLLLALVLVLLLAVRTVCRLNHIRNVNQRVLPVVGTYPIPLAVLWCVREGCAVVGQRRVKLLLPGLMVPATTTRPSSVTLHQRPP